jgi:HAE1 family hydrophobic/amphiphilic exporter-1
MLCSRFLRPGNSHTGSPGAPGTKDTWLFRIVDRPYRAMLRWSMSHRWAIVLLSVLVFLSTIPAFKAVGKSFLPTDDQSEFEVTVRMPIGSALEGSEAVMTQLEAELRSLPHVRYLLTTIGADAQRRPDRGSIVVGLTPAENRKESQLAIMAAARQKLAKFRDLTIGVQLPAIISGSGPNKDLQFFIQGPDLAQLNRYTQVFRARLAQMRGVTDIDSSYEEGKPEIRVRINRDKAADLNVSVSSIANAMRTLVGGDDQVTTYREGDDRYDVQLRVDRRYRSSPAALERLYVPSATLGNVPASNVAAFEEGSGPVQIERVNRQRQILITANIVEGQALSNVLPVLAETEKSLNMPASYSTGLIGQSKEFGRAALLFVIAFGLSIIFMYMVLAAQFESFVDPVTILISLPLSIPFALGSLWLAGENFSIVYTSLGILILFGIVKKNAILQVDHIKSLRRDGMPRFQAIIKGCEDRLRPILMTTAALVAGMIPLALGSGAGAGTRRTVAIVVIGGQSLCLLLTLLLTPVAYSIFDDIGSGSFLPKFLRRRRSEVRPAHDYAD